MRWPAVAIIIFLYLLLATCVFSAARARAFAPTPLPYSCDEVRWAFHHYTREHLYQMAKDTGIVITPVQRRQATLCLTKGG